MALLILEKIAILALHGEISSSYTVYAFGGLMMGFHLLGTCLWLGITRATWIGCSTSANLYDVPSICVMDGPKVAIANIFFIAAFLSYFFFIFHKRSTLHLNKKVSFGKFLWIKGKH